MEHGNDEAAPGIDAAALADLIESNDVFVLDVRGSARGEQIYGALRYDPKKLLDAPKLALPLPQTQTPVVLYDEDGSSADLAILRAKLIENGFAGATVLTGGFRAWRDADGRTEGATIEQAVPLVSTHQPER